MIDVPASIQDQFVLAGWRLGQSNAPTNSSLIGSSTAVAVLSEFGGLHVGSSGPGQDLAKSDVEFFVNVKRDADICVQPWLKSIGRLDAIANAHHDHMIIFIGPDGAFYFFTDPDGKLYLGGSSFGEAMERLLLGLAYGPEIQRA